jgi:hypothetical protein
MVSRRRIKPIETFYNSYRFRSRLEARWAVFFDALRLRYEYEPEGYDLGPDVGPYLPDFWLPAQSGFRGGFVEIKPEEPSYIERRRCEALAEGLGRDVYVFYEPIEVPCPLTNPYTNPAIVFLGSGGWDDDHYWCQCWGCNAVGIEYAGWAARLSCSCPEPLASYVKQNPKRSETYSSALRDAFEAARQERFERAS